MVSVPETVVALFVALLAALSTAVMLVLTEYSEYVGATWYQILFTEYWVNLFFTFWYWILSFSYTYYFEFDRLKVKHNNLTSHLLSVFPPINASHVNHWLVLILRSIFALLCTVFLNIGLMYVSSGDCVLIESVVASITSFIFGFIFFNEKINKMIIFAFVLFVGGIILVTQPTFIFTSTNDSNAASSIGLFWVFLGSLTEGLSFVVIKCSQTVELSHTTVMIAPQAIMSFELLILYIYGWQVLNWNSSIVSVENNIDKVLQLCIGFVFFVWLISAVIGFQLGNLGRVGMISNSNIVFAYMLQAVILNEFENYICYIGIVITLIGCVIVFYEQYEEQTDELLTDNDDDDDATLSRLIIADSDDCDVEDCVHDQDQCQSEDDMYNWIHDNK